MATRPKKAKAKEAKAHKATICIDDLRDPRWWHLLKLYTLLFPQHGPSTGLDLSEALRDRKLRRCVRRRANSSQCEEVSEEFWQSHKFFENSPYFGGLGIYDPAVTTVYDPQTHLDAREFYVWQPDCVKVWPALARQEVDARKAKPRRARKRSTRKASQRAGTGSAIEAGDSAAASGSLCAAEAGDTAAVAGPLKRKRRGKLTAEQIKDGVAYVRDHPELKPKQAYPGLRRELRTGAISNTTLWRHFYQK
jgi:hypothetical protein